MSKHNRKALHKLDLYFGSYQLELAINCRSSCTLTVGYFFFLSEQVLYLPDVCVCVCVVVPKNGQILYSDHINYL